MPTGSMLYVCLGTFIGSGKQCEALTLHARLAAGVSWLKTAARTQQFEVSNYCSHLGALIFCEAYGSPSLGYCAGRHQGGLRLKMHHDASNQDLSLPAHVS